MLGESGLGDSLEQAGAVGALIEARATGRSVGEAWARGLGACTMRECRRPGDSKLCPVPYSLELEQVIWPLWASGCLSLKWVHSRAVSVLHISLALTASAQNAQLRAATTCIAFT